MEKLRYKLILLILTALCIVLGPFLLSDQVADAGWLFIPYSYWLVFGVWLVFIIVSAVIIEKSNW
jgi:tryptophan-rich sensory protein